MNQNDEIKLVDIGYIVWKFRIWIIIIVLIFTGASTWYAFSQKPIIGARVTIRPTDVSDIERLGVLRLYHHFFKHTDFNLFNHDQNPLILVAYLYKQMVLNLNSDQVRREFVKSFNRLQRESQSQRVLMPNISIRYGRHFGRRIQDDDIIVVSIQGDDPAYLKQYLNSFIAFANIETLKSFKSMLQAKVKQRREALINEIECYRIAAKKARKQKIERLKEALAVAKEIGKDGAYLGPEKKYHGGVKALESEIKALKARQNDDPFILELPKLQAQIQQLTFIRFDLDGVKAAKVDNRVTIHEASINRTLTISIGAIAGLMAGVFIAFLSHFIKNARTHH